jgi:hypothetical protein
VTWENDAALRIDTEAGTQTRVFRFGARGADAAASTPTWQGESVAAWDLSGRGGGMFGGPPPRPSGALKVVTTHIRPGYLRKNGVPFSEKTTLTEYWDLLRQPTGEQWIVITTVVEDPTYLSRTWITSLNFKKEANGSKWDPSACEAS